MTSHDVPSPEGRGPDNLDDSRSAGWSAIMWKSRKRRTLTLIVLLIMASNLLYLWLPFRVAAVQLFLQLGGSRVFIGVEYSPLNNPRYIPVSQAGEYASDTEVIGVELFGIARAVPVKRLAWNMVLNDTFSGEPVVVALCTVADAAMAYHASHLGRALHFRPIGLARNNLVLRDEETGSSWQQFTGRAISGEFAGADLRPIPVERLPLETWCRRHPQGSILAPLGNEQDSSTPHDTCPVMQYFPDNPFLLQVPAKEDERFPRKTAVTGLVRSDGRSFVCPRGEEASLPAAQDFSTVPCYWFAWTEFHPGSHICRAK